MKLWHVLLVGIIIGIFLGYTWHYQATKNMGYFDKKECKIADVMGEKIVLADGVKLELLK